MVYDRELTDSEMQLVHQYLAKRYGAQFNRGADVVNI